MTLTAAGRGCCRRLRRARKPAARWAFQALGRALTVPVILPARLTTEPASASDGDGESQATQAALRGLAQGLGQLLRVSPAQPSLALSQAQSISAQPATPQHPPRSSTHLPAPFVAKKAFHSKARFVPNILEMIQMTERDARRGPARPAGSSHTEGVLEIRNFSELESRRRTLLPESGPSRAGCRSAPTPPSRCSALGSANGAGPAWQRWRGALRGMARHGACAAGPACAAAARRAARAREAATSFGSRSAGSPSWNLGTACPGGACR